jgi:asparagine synthase (glutamine-hydrolysing)
MCGICGFWNLDGRSVDLGGLQRMTETLRHRGPDDEGYLISDGDRLNVETGCFGFGHTRLSIIDLSAAGRQPMSDASADLWIVFNGEMYNFQEVSAELSSRGYKFRTRTDTEVILHAYREWGIDGIRRFNGMFALALWDRRTNQLHLVRDRLGVKPLYYYRRNGSFAFSSELKALLAFPYFRKELDFDALLQYFIFQYVPHPKSIFKNTWKLAPGHILTVHNDGRLEDRSYWNLSAAIARAAEAPVKSEEECLEELDGLLTQSVRYRLISDVPLGAFLSGGVDSSLIVAIMQKLSSQPVKTFSIGFDDPQQNEAPDAKGVANHLSTQHQELYLGPRQVSDLLPQMADFYDEPFADTVTLPTMLLAKLARSQVTVSLSGDGGDELFGGYTRYNTIARLDSLYRVPYALRAAAGVLNRIPVKPIQDHSFWLQPRKGIEDAYLDLMSTWNRNALCALTGVSDVDLSESVFHQTFAENGSRPAAELAPLVDIKTYLVDCILTKLDRASMSVGLEAREPLLDYRLVEFAVGLPTRWKMHNGTQKHLLRKLLTKYLPQPLFERPKQGFNMPLWRWLRAEMKDLTEMHLNDAYLRKQGMFDPSVVRQTIEEHVTGVRDHHPKLYSLIVFQLWYSKYMSAEG